MESRAEGNALRLTMEVWHPDCWVIRTSERVDVGVLGYGIHAAEDGRTSTFFTVYADERATVDEALDAIRASPHVYGVAEMTHGYRLESVATPGNATRDLLVAHDGTTQISPSFTSRGFVYAEPVDVRGGIERWTVLTDRDRETVRRLLEEIREERDAEITVTGVTRADRTGGTGGTGGLPLDRLSRRQREVFRLARDRGYYAWPRRASAGELAAELGITTSTLHEHLRKIEAKLLGEPCDGR
ncbi:helix-turn-helix domain-containing protein [Halomarina pelagica]|uniref:helix-turn-helix domain-containing protein n=1 Tax=Halomarina pelagica TaxID=2961599 RepID=UPI0020C202B6|nr:helix-turn-helix domain-containing protein [Halomarina sp. BND7]